jgi:hypothetical protein
MSWKVWIVAVAALIVGVTAADAKRHRRDVRPPPAPAGDIWPYSTRWDQPAHFVRLPNGLVVSSYECFTDEGYGRYLACGAGRR